MTTTVPITLGYKELAEILPYSYPFLLIDKVVEYTKDVSLTAVKNITADEWALGGLTTASTVYPETLLIESAAQAALVLYHVSRVRPGTPAPLYVLGKVTAEFVKEVRVGDRMELRARAGKMLSTGGYADVDIFVNEAECGRVSLIYGVRQ